MDGETKHVLSGKWNESVSCLQAGRLREQDHRGKEPMPEDPTKYGFTNFTFKQNSHETCPPGLPGEPTRACARPRSSAERGDDALAGAKKYELEELQRAERRLRRKQGRVRAQAFKLATDADLHELEQDVGTPVSGTACTRSPSANGAPLLAAEGANPLESLVFDPWCYEETRSGKAVVGEEGETTEA